MSKRLIIFTFSLLVGFSPCLLLAQNKPNEKKLIEFGWDMPKISFLKANISDMEKMPFDGVVFTYDFHIYNAFDTTYRPESLFQYNDLANIQWKRFTDNFLLVRGAGFTGAHWLDDASWIKITENLKKVSKSLVGSNVKGIGFDAEYYYEPEYNPWIYKPSLYNNLSFEEVGNYVRKRGTQFIQALQTDKPDVKILCFWLLGLASLQSQNHPIAETGMALYPFFVEGMLDGKNNTSEIIDGNENSYGYIRTDDFIISGDYLRKQGSKLIKESSQSKLNQVSHAQAIFLDKIYGNQPQLDKGFDKQTKENWLENNLYAAYKTTDKYVWIYDEKTDWWKNRVDTAGAAIINEVRNKINAEQNNKGEEFSGKSVIFNFAKKEPENYQGFSYNYSKSKNILQIELPNNGIKSLEVFQNSRTIYSVNNPALHLTVDLNNKYNKTGNLIIIAKDGNGKTSVSFVN